MRKYLVGTLQFVVAYFVGFVPALFVPIPSGWELAWFALGSAIGVWGIGAAFGEEKGANKFWTAFIGGAVGSGLILVVPAYGFVLVLLPMLGALLGYYLIPVGKE